MRKYYLFILLLGLFTLTFIVIGFFRSGSPFKQQMVKYDDERLSNFGSIKSDIENYYSKNKELPENINILKSSNTSSYSLEKYNDPETKSQYEYKVVDTKSYELCATFSLSSDELRQKRNNDYLYDAPNSTDTNYSKGYNCLKYTLPEYIVREANPTPTFRGELQPSPTYI